ncbi:Protein CBG15819 [Caenorhabditis briggsae]|uniref:NADP-dependent oxidoreductase domain-containing protein n=4 Tax=Caenorhabditis briggsae TaxID=6238 RepID=A0AAE9E8Z6_CAEBR|nr:Protein CBG15819 [Caenorhabditis briggsae]ULU13965.1 hypothetical protein L3Y34_016464 [Caenorhabditis briggsae]UMM14905.1 hypothetical protein L5515_002542 [Caenorhabditis briggsae]CAP34009.2 Protein CBG15819 [Caenorhabditis briggsae]
MMSGTPHSLTLSNGTPIPTLGLGTWQSAPDVVGAAVKAAIKAGYRLIDTATCYQNEEAIGTAILELIKEGVVKREDLFITTKAWTNEIAPGKLEPALEESLKRLKTDYVDLYLAHMPTAFNDDMTEKIAVSVEEIWKQFDAIHKKGLAKAVGVSNWNEKQIKKALDLNLTPVHVSQVELHLYFPQNEHVAFCKKHNIIVTSYATLGSPGRVDFQLPNGGKLEWAPAPQDMEDQSVKDLAKKHGKTPAQILLRHTLQRGLTMIPKSTNEARIQENHDIFDFQLTHDDMAKLQGTQVSQRLFLQDFMEGHPEDAFADERLKK